MKLSASLLGRVVQRAGTDVYSHKVAASLAAGQRFRLIDGSSVQVLQTITSVDGLRVRLASRAGVQSMSVRQFVDLGLASPAMTRLAGFIRLALSADLDIYVKEAIKAAGLPVDDKMNWTRWFGRIYNNTLNGITNNEDIKEDAIRHMIVKYLYEDAILSPAPGNTKKFDPERLGAGPLAEKVTSFLIYLFFNNGKREVEQYASVATGLGAGSLRGDSVRESLDGTRSESDSRPLEPADPTSLRPHTELEGHEEVHKFLDAFEVYISRSQQAETAKFLNMLSDGFAHGKDRKEIRDMVQSNPDFQAKVGRDDPQALRKAYAFLLAQWCKKIKEFAQNDAEFAGTSIAKLIVNAVENELKQKDEEKSKAALASLRLAAVEEPTELPSTTTGVGTQAPPAPPNPNVQQQQELKNQQTQGQTAPPQPVQQTGLAAPPKTIPPEIPGENHMVTSAQLSQAPYRLPKVKAIVATPVKEEKKEVMVNKFARLKTVASTEPREVAKALRALSGAFSILAGQLDTFHEKLDLNDLPNGKTASIKQRVAHRNKYAATLKRLATESPEDISQALNDVYQQLDEITDGVETLADNLGVELQAPVEPKDGESILDSVETDESPVPELPKEPASEPVTEAL